MKINRLPYILQYVSTCITAPGRNHDLTNYVSYIIYCTVFWFYGCLSKKIRGKQKRMYRDEICTSLPYSSRSELYHSPSGELIKYIAKVTLDVCTILLTMILIRHIRYETQTADLKGFETFATCFFQSVYDGLQKDSVNFLWSEPDSVAVILRKMF